MALSCTINGSKQLRMENIVKPNTTVDAYLTEALSSKDSVLFPILIVGATKLYRTPRLPSTSGWKRLSMLTQVCGDLNPYLSPVCSHQISHRLRTYCLDTDFDGPKTAVFLRPWQLPHRADFGLRGASDAARYPVIQVFLFWGDVLLFLVT